MSRRGWLIILLAVTVLALLPTVAGSQVEIRFPAEPDIAPGETRRIEVTIIYTYDSGTTTGEVDVDLRTSASSPASARIAPDPLTIQVNDQRQRGSGTATLTVTMAEGATAFSTHDVEIGAKARSSGTVEASEWTEEIAVVQVPFVPALELSLDVDTVTVAPGSMTPLDVQVVNRGNGPARYRLEAITAPEAAGVVPPPATVLSHQQGANDKTVTVRFFRASSSGPASGEVQIHAVYDFHQNTTLSHRSNVVSLTLAEQPGAGGLLPIVGAVAVVAVGGLALYWFKFR